MTPPTKTPWEERLEDTIRNKCGNLEITQGEICDGTIEPLKAFITSIREEAYEKGMQYNYDLGRAKGTKEERTRFKEEIERMRETGKLCICEPEENDLDDCECPGYQEALDQVLSIIKQ